MASSTVTLMLRLHFRYSFRTTVPSVQLTPAVPAQCDSILACHMHCTMSPSTTRLPCCTIRHFEGLITDISTWARIAAAGIHPTLPEGYVAQTSCIGCLQCQVHDDRNPPILRTFSVRRWPSSGWERQCGYTARRTRPTPYQGAGMWTTSQVTVPSPAEVYYIARDISNTACTRLLSSSNKGRSRSRVQP